MAANSNKNGNNKALYWGFGGFAVLTIIGFFILVVGFLGYLIIDAKNDAKKNDSQVIINDHENTRKKFMTEEDLKREKILREDDARRDKIKTDMMDEMRAISQFQTPQYQQPPCNNCPEKEQKTRTIVRNHTRYITPQYPQLPQQQQVVQQQSYDDSNLRSWTKDNFVNNEKFDGFVKNEFEPVKKDVGEIKQGVNTLIEQSRLKQKQNFQPKQEDDEDAELHQTEKN